MASKGKVKAVSNQGGPAKVTIVSDCSGTATDDTTTYTVTNPSFCTRTSIGDIVKGTADVENSEFEVSSCSCS